MKKTLFLFLISPIVFMGCKKDKTDAAQETILGKWTEKSYYYEYFNSSGTKVFSETDQGDATWDFSESTVVYKTSQSPAKSSAYSIKTSGNKKLISFTDASIAQGIEMEIKTMSGNSMTWSAESSDVEYYDNGVKRASKATLLVTFTK